MILLSNMLILISDRIMNYFVKNDTLKVFNNKYDKEYHKYIIHSLNRV